MSSERVEQAQRIYDQYNAEYEAKKRELEDHESFKNGAPTTPEEREAYISKKEQLEAQMEKVEEQKK